MATAGAGLCERLVPTVDHLFTFPACYKPTTAWARLRVHTFLLQARVKYFPGMTSFMVTALPGRHDSQMTVVETEADKTRPHSASPPGLTRMTP